VPGAEVSILAQINAPSPQCALRIRDGGHDVLPVRPNLILLKKVPD
jgi:hypothetical protein